MPNEDDPDPIDNRAVRRNVRWMFALIAGAAILGGVLGGVLTLRPHHARNGHHSAPLAVAIAVGAAFLVVAAAGATFWWLARRPSYRRVMQFSWTERRAVLKALKRGQPLTERQRGLARALSEFTTRNRWTLAAFPLGAVGMIFNAAAHHGPLRWFWLLLAVLYLSLWPVTMWQRRRLVQRLHRALGDQPRP